MPYAPDDAALTLDLLEQLRAQPDLLSAAETALRHETPASIAALRKVAPPPLAQAALAIARGRLKSRAKFGADSPFLWSPPEAIEQASSALAAAHKAARFAAVSPASLLDLCCGIGSDTLALANIAPTTALDLSPIRLWCLNHNLASVSLLHTVTTRQADLATVDFSTLREHSAFHIDPARRSGGRRLHAYDDILPGPEVLARLMTQVPAGAIKLSPAVDFASLPAGHLELLSEPAAVTQAVLWTGTLAAPFPPGTRTVTALRPGVSSFSYSASPTTLAPEPSEPQAYLYEIDPAAHRAGLAPALAAELSLHPVNEDGGYVTGPVLLRHPLLTPFAHLETLPYDEKRLTRALANLTGPAGPVEVKTRGRIGLDTDTLQRRLSAHAAAGCTLLVYRAGGIRAALCRRV